MGTTANVKNRFPTPVLNSGLVTKGAASPDPSPVGPSAPAQALRALGVRPSRGLSQSFLASEAIASLMVRAAEVAPGDRVIEIGPGLGILTAALLRVGARVLALEIDSRLADALPHILEASGLSRESVSRLDLACGDALELFSSCIPEGPCKVVASLPYSVATPIIERLLAADNVTEMVVMVQLEVARRMTAWGGSGTYLSVAVQSRAGAEIIRTVPPGCFYPRPKVRSGILRISPHPPTLPREEIGPFLELVRAGFQQPRRQLRNSLALGLGSTPQRAEELCQQASLDPERRPSTLSIDHWLALYRAWEASPVAN